MIDKYSFGSITIDGRTYDTDVIIYPERIDDRWWRKEGHWLQLADLGGVRETHPSVLVVGTGYFERMYVDPSVSDWLQQQGITLIACDTTRACTEFNRLKETQKVVAVLHLAC
ncbi:MAG: MTH938/NDUFAF3 family protein [Nitrospira sp.]|nr:MTH938/NDUFAF3 family protein [Nitrospira sp.]